MRVFLDAWFPGSWAQEQLAMEEQEGVYLLHKAG